MGVYLAVVLGATKTRNFPYKSGGTPNPQGKKVEVTPNPDKIFASAAARSPSCGGRRKNFIWVSGYSHFYALWVRGTPTFCILKTSSFRQKPHGQHLGNSEVGNILGNFVSLYFFLRGLGVGGTPPQLGLDWLRNFL